MMSAVILACGGSSLLLAADGCRLCAKHVFNSATNAWQWCSAVFVSRMHDRTRVMQISTTDWSLVFFW